MTKTEFMEVLQRTLAGSLGSGTVSGHMRYYQDYFDSQLAMGKDEMQITAELGDPRLLAKTIIEAAKREGIGGGTPEYDEVYEDGTAEPKGNGRVKAYRMPVWLVAVLVFMVLFVIVGMVTSVVTALLPVLLPVLAVLLVVRLVRNR